MGSRKASLERRLMGHTLTGKVPLENPPASLVNFTGVARHDDRKGERRDHPGKAQGAFVLLDYGKDVISKQKNEQHLFTLGAKY